MNLHGWTLLLVVFAVSAMLGFLFAVPAPAEAGGCILTMDQTPFMLETYCIDSLGSRCYECYYADDHNDGFEYCVENADGSIKNCQFFEDIQSAP